MALPQRFRLGRFNSGHFHSSKRVHGNFFTIFKKNIQNSEVKLAISVSKKISKKSTIRNKIRRLTSSSFLNYLDLIPSGHYLVLPNAKVLNSPFIDLKSDIENIFSLKDSLK